MSRSFARLASVIAAGLMITSSCGSPALSPVEDLAGAQPDVSRLVLQSLQGTRDGDRLEVLALYGDETRRLRVNMHFKVTPPTKLETGTWTGLTEDGTVRERSVTFLGGQSGAPSIGGRFDLVGPDERPLYRITIPLQELKQPL